MCVCLSMCSVSVLAEEESVYSIDTSDFISISDDSVFYEAPHYKCIDGGYYSLTPDSSGDITVTNLRSDLYDFAVLISFDFSNYRNLDVSSGGASNTIWYNPEDMIYDSTSDSFTLNIFDVMNDYKKDESVEEFFKNIYPDDSSIRIRGINISIALFSKDGYLVKDAKTLYRVYCLEDSLGAINKHFAVLYEDAMTFNPDKNPCKDAEKYIDISMNSREYEGSVSFGDSYFYESFEPYVTFSTLDSGEEITITNVSENKDVKLLVGFDALFPEDGSYKLDLNNRYLFDSEGNFHDRGIFRSDFVSKDISADFYYCESDDDNFIDDGEGDLALKLSAGESFTFSFPKTKVDVLWSLIVYYYATEMKEYTNTFTGKLDTYEGISFDGVSMQGIFVEGIDGENDALSDDSGKYIDISFGGSKVDLEVPIYVDCQTDILDSNVVDSYYVFERDDEITLKNISEDENVYLFVQTEALPFKSEYVKDGVVSDLYSYVSDDSAFDASELLRYVSDTNGNYLWQGSLLDSLTIRDMNTPLILKSGETATFKLSDTYPNAMWAVSVCYFTPDASSFWKNEVYWVQVLETPFYYDAVKWGYEAGITKGTSDSSFSPDQQCTHNEILTFLWRGRGCDTSFLGENEKELAKGYDDFTLARLWAESILGYKIDGSAFCTRYDAVNYIYKLHPHYNDLYFENLSIGYADNVYDKDTTDYRALMNFVGYNFVDLDDSQLEAVAFSCIEEVTKGTSDTTFSPDKVCTRAEIMTFMYRNSYWWNN